MFSPVWLRARVRVKGVAEALVDRPTRYQRRNIMESAEKSDAYGTLTSFKQRPTKGAFTVSGSTVAATEHHETLDAGEGLVANKGLFARHRKGDASAHGHMDDLAVVRAGEGGLFFFFFTRAMDGYLLSPCLLLSSFVLPFVT